jgi:hypothetical protein
MKLWPKFLKKRSNIILEKTLKALKWEKIKTKSRRTLRIPPIKYRRPRRSSNLWFRN